MALVLEDTLETIKNKQWALADINWDAPGAELIREDQFDTLKQFMADLVWIENVGARGFEALVRKAPNDTVKEIYRYFHAEEQKHANAELALMRRWGMIGEDEMPEPNVNIRLAIEWIDTYSDDLPLSFLGTVIPMLETALDGALVKFLLDEVADPVCHQVFAHINSDESRHLAVGYHVLDLIGQASMRKLLIETVGALASPALIIGALMYVPLLSRMRRSMGEMGLDEARLDVAVSRFKRVGERSEFIRRVPIYQVIKTQAEMAVDQSHPYHRFVADPLVWASAKYPRRLLKPIPSWFRELTYKPVA